MKKMKTILIACLLVMFFAATALCTPSDLVGKTYTPALAQELADQYGPEQKIGTDNKYAFLYFQGGNFTLTILIQNRTIVDLKTGTR